MCERAVTSVCAEDAQMFGCEGAEPDSSPDARSPRAVVRPVERQQCCVEGVPLLSTGMQSY